MYLEMHLGNVIVERKEISLAHKTTCHEREEYLIDLSELMYKKHILKIITANKDPIFYVTHVESRMNNIRTVSWQNLIKRFGAAGAKKNICKLIKRLEKESVYA